MSFTLGRLDLDDPEAFPEDVGEQVARVGATPVPGGRAGLSFQASLTSFPAATGDTATDRQRVRRQLRSMHNNRGMSLAGVYVAWSEDSEQNGWYALGKANFDVGGAAALVSSFWRFTGVELALIGRNRTHKRAVYVYLRDRRTSTTPRDFLSRIYSTDFSDQTPVGLTFLPSTVTSPVMTGGSVPQLTAARNGYGASTLQAVPAGTDLALVSFEQSESARNIGDVVAYDRRGTLSLTTTGPTTGWEEFYGADWPLTSSDVPVLDNSLTRVTYDSTNTDGFVIERWLGSTWTVDGKVLLERRNGAGTFCDALVSAGLVEWTPDRAVARAVMTAGTDPYSREDVYITLQRGWTGPRFEVYPAQRSGGTTAGAGVYYFGTLTSGTNYARKDDDAGTVTVTGTPTFTAGTVGNGSSGLFNDRNYLAFSQAGGAQVTLAVLQASALARVESSSSAWGAARNGVSVRLDSGGYISAHLGMVSHTGGTLQEQRISGATNDYNGALDLGQSILYDARSPQTIISRDRL